MTRGRQKPIERLFIKRARLRSIFLKAARRRLDFLTDLFSLTESGGVIFRRRLELPEAVLTYLLAKWFFWVVNKKINPSATLEELGKIPFLPSGSGDLSEIIGRLSNPEEMLLIPTETGYMLNPERIDETIKHLEDYVAMHLGG